MATALCMHKYGISQAYVLSTLCHHRQHDHGIQCKGLQSGTPAETDSTARSGESTLQAACVPQGKPSLHDVLKDLSPLLFGQSSACSQTGYDPGEAFAGQISLT